MPTTITAVIIILVCVFPGVLGDRVYRTLVGIDWREKQFGTSLRLIGFSIIGAVIYSLIAELLTLPPPLHLFPSEWEALAADHKRLGSILFPYSGHLVGGIIAGIIAAYGIKFIAKLSRASEFPCAWDAFARRYAPKHWVIVGLSNGDVYAGILKNADVSVAAADRDLVLEEPCLYDKESSNYQATSYQHLFIAANTIFSIATVHDPKLEKRMVSVGKNLFKGAES